MHYCGLEGFEIEFESPEGNRLRLRCLSQGSQTLEGVGTEGRDDCVLYGSMATAFINRETLALRTRRLFLASCISLRTNSKVIRVCST